MLRSIFDYFNLLHDFSLIMNQVQKYGECIVNFTCYYFRNIYFLIAFENEYHVRKNKYPSCHFTDLF